MPDTDRKVFIDNKGVIYPFGVGAAGQLFRLGSDVVLTGSPIQQFGVPAEVNVGYDYEAQLYLDVTGAGTVTVNTGISGGALVRACQITHTTGVVAEVKTVFGTTVAALVSSSIATGSRSMLIRGSAITAALAGTLYVDMATAGTVSLLAGSTLRVWRTN